MLKVLNRNSTHLLQKVETVSRPRDARRRSKGLMDVTAHYQVVPINRIGDSDAVVTFAHLSKARDYFNEI